MTNHLFREVLDGKIPVPPKRPASIPHQEWQFQALRNIWGPDAFQDAIGSLIKAGIVTLPLPTEPRARALAVKSARGKGPQPPAGWRGKERNTKYRSQ